MTTQEGMDAFITAFNDRQLGVEDDLAKDVGLSEDLMRFVERGSPGGGRKKRVKEKGKRKTARTSRKRSRGKNK
jgi:hypothetical protein